MINFAHISDPHLSPLPPVTFRQVANKRVLGYLSWHRKRKHEHQAHVLRALCADLMADAPDHICITGDLTNLGLPEEYAAAAAWLRQFGDPSSVSVIPGNHDAYIAMPRDVTRDHWAAWMAGDAPDSGFPYLRRRGFLSLIGVNTAVPTGPFMASGRIGRDQLRRLSACLDAEGQAGQCRVVLIHHPPQRGAVGWRKSLHDAAVVRDVLARTGAELVLHGHLHKPVLASLTGPSGPIPVLGAGSASAAGTHKGQSAQYHRIQIRPANSETRYHLSATARVWSNRTQSFEDGPSLLP